MYIAVYDENQKHITNLDNAVYDLTMRVYDPDGFNATGQSTLDINDAKIAVLNDDYGNYIYACLIDTVKPEDNAHTIKGLDFKTIFDTDIILDYTPAASFDGRLSAIFRRVASLVVDDPDVAIKKIPIELIIPDDDTDTAAAFGDYQGTYKITNAYTFLKAYLKYYEYNVETRYDEPRGKIVIAFIKCAERISVNLADFIYELQTSSDATNKAVATITYKPETAEGEAIPPRPPSIATVYYYRDKDNNVIQADAAGDIPGRIYPVRCKVFESDYLADAQFDAAYEIANSRYVDNVILDHNKIIDPIDLSGLALYTKLDIYYGGAFYKTLPVSEKITKADAAGVNVQIKLGFKKILLTEIIKG